MTGEVTLRGKVLAIGGLKSKTIAAHRAGVKTVLLPKDNAKDIPELPDSIRKELELIPVSHLHEVLSIALLHGTEPPFTVAAGNENMNMPLPPTSSGSGVPPLRADA
jgi:ATP-dependent Lon protease